MSSNQQVMLSQKTSWASNGLLNNLISYYKSDWNGNDTHASNNLTDTSVSWVSWKINDAASFNGSSSTLRTTSSLWINWWACSYSCWVKLNAEIASSIWSFVAQGNTTTTKTTFYIYYNYNGGTRRLTFGRTRNSVVDQLVTYNITMWTSNYYHLVLTYDWTTVNWYVNGVSIWTVSASWNWSWWWVTWFDIWAWNGWTVFFANAIIDEVWVWSASLTSAQVTSLYNWWSWLAYSSFTS